MKQLAYWTGAAMAAKNASLAEAPAGIVAEFACSTNVMIWS
jgi:hypothetical protein